MSSSLLLDLDVGPISGPASLGLPARNREMGIFNPSLAIAPPSLCPRCAYVVAMRVDPLHQCHDNSPLLHPDPGMPKGVAANAWFKGTAIAVMDRELRVLGWTWLLNAPQHQVSSQRTPSRWFVPVGVADRFPPPWAKSVYDVRVLRIDEHLFVSYVCRKCAFSVAQLQLTGRISTDGGLSELRAWQSRRFSSTAAWAQGRNQALFVASRDSGGADELMVQPWLGVVGSFGAPIFQAQKTLCGTPPKGKRPRALGAAVSAGFRVCGATPTGTILNLHQISNERSHRRGRGGFGWLELLSNATRAELSRAAVGGFRLSTTSNLVRLQRDDGCAALLGVGHVHRSDGELNQRMAMPDDTGEVLQRRRRRRGARKDRAAQSFRNDSIVSSNASHTKAPSSPFMWGYHYTHFFYLTEAHAPFRVVATSGEFCLQSQQDKNDCESIQFISGLTVAPSESDATNTLLLSYGINDCESKVAKLPIDRVWSMLRPLPGAGADTTCSPAGEHGADAFGERKNM